ncbi:hypothetical protein [Magnetospirillum sp. UT-4]|uniref:hypothetical protein n=1 Tax=Magnetospirillum sp. UT-4 TaxID=2681467 RepID=UPI0015748959|nr:hypothetical protein [Magnetospirillum sp. UT-4]
MGKVSRARTPDAGSGVILPSSDAAPPPPRTLTAKQQADLAAIDDDVARMVKELPSMDRGQALKYATARLKKGASKA